MRRFKNHEIALEGLRSLIAQPVRTMGIVLACAILGAGVAMVTVWDVGQADRSWHLQTYAGSHVFSVTAADGAEAQISAERCAETSVIEGVKFAGGIIGTHEALSSASPGSRFSLIEATPGYLQIAYPRDPSDERWRGTIAGESISMALGLTDDSVLSYRVQGNPRPQLLVIEDHARGSAMRESHDNAVVVSVPPRGNVSECLIAPLQGSFPAIATALEDWFAPVDVRVTTVLRASELLANPVRLLQARVSQWVPIGVGVVLVGFIVFGWWAQRASYAIYLALGASSKQMSLMFLVETTVTCWVPVSAGFLISTGLGDGLSSDVLAAALVRDYASLGVILSTLPAQGALALRQRSAFDAAKGR